MFQIALAQINPTVGDFEGNQRKILDTIQKAKNLNAQVVVFPEMAVCGYPPEDLLHKEHFIKDNLKTLRCVAKKIKNVIVIVGFVDADKQKNLYNAAAVITKGKIQGIYHKQHLPNYGVFDEKRYFRPGKGNKIFSFGKIKFSLSICEDIWVEQKKEKKTSRNEYVHINISSSPYDVGKIKQRENLIKRRAKEAKRFVCFVNIVGGQDELVFDGSSLIVSPQGQVIAQGKVFQEDLIVCDLAKDDQKKLPQKTTQIQRIYKALILGTHDYIVKNGFQKVVMGLSGGIDSTLVATVAVDAIGKENVVAVSMPSRFTSKGTRTDAQTLANNLGIPLLKVPVENLYKEYLKTLSGVFQGVSPDITEENIQARIRGNILMALSNKFGWLVLTTGNKSEVAVGYCTLYGDLSGGFAVLKDVPKTTVYELARYKNRQGKEVIPLSIIARAPTAELKKNQKDQDLLPPYDVLDAILKSYVEEHRSFEKMSRQYKPEILKRVVKMVDNSEYKRRQSPPGIKITPRSFGKDWRLPITNRYKKF